MAIQSIVRARVDITGTKLEKALQAARREGPGMREKIFKRIDEGAAAAVGGTKGPDERGVPDILDVPSGSILGNLISDGSGVDPDIEWKAVTSAKSPEILSSVVSHSIPTFQELVGSGKITIAELSDDIANSIIQSEKRLQREQAVLTRTRGAGNLEKQQEKIDTASQRLEYKQSVAKDLQNAIIKNPDKVINLLGIAKLRQIVDADTKLMRDIRRKVNNIAFAVIKDPAKKRKTDGLFLLSGVAKVLTVNDLAIESRKEGNTVRLTFRFTDKFFKQLIGETATKAGDNLHKYLEKPIKNITASGDIGKILGMGISLAPGGRTPITLIYNLYNPKLNYRPLKGTPKVTSTKKTKERKRSQFISNVQLSAILQKRLEEVMPRFSEPQRPTPRYVTGKLAKSFQMMANYRAGLIGFYNTPPASGYVDELNQNGWMLDKTLVEPTIRVITQQLFGRQFKVLRTQ